MLISNSSENVIVKYLSSEKWLSLLEKQLKMFKKQYILYTRNRTPTAIS